MPVPPRCRAGYRQDACSTKMPVPPRCLFHQDAPGNCNRQDACSTLHPYSLFPVPCSLFPTANNKTQAPA
ncbi:MAG: hypothetical protein F6K56_36370 [Moorea sp. SIO3G5]|nr:hypothetical protein [Moorena sp. SIO3G5]